ncbi:MAG: mechanosensitive ion channel family protein [Planctomycetota bacterium]
MGQDIGALLAGLGIGGLAIALASRDTVENFFGALTIITDRPFEVGDWIKMGDIEGTVAHIGFRSTRVRTFYDSVTTFPNSKLIRSAVDNLGSRHYRRLKFELGVAYDTPADKLETFIEGIRELIRLHPYTRKDYYHVYFHSFGPSSLNILCYLFLRTPEWATELRERQRMLMDILRLANGLGVEFAFPTQTLHVMQGEPPAHAAPAGDLSAAWKRGQAEAKRIVEEFTGDRVPPPVKIGQRPDESLDDGGPAPRRVAGRRRGVTSPAAPYRGSGPTERMDGQLLELPTIDAADNKSAKKPVDTQIAFIELIAERLGLDPALQRSDGDMRNVGQVEPEVRA